jgi:PAS domain S-box-containing protein
VPGSLARSERSRAREELSCLKITGVRAVAALSVANSRSQVQVTGSVLGAEQLTAPAAGTTGAAVHDITARRQAEEQIRRTAALLEVAHDAIFVRDLDGRITYWNAGAERTYGFSRAEAVGRISHDMLRTRFPEPLTSIEAATTGSSSWDGELTQRCADGRSIIVESRWAAQRAPDGSLLGFMEVNRDITARRQAEEEIRRTAALLEAARDAIFVRDLDGRITYWNEGAERTYGFSRAEAVGRISHDMLRTRFPEPLTSIEAATTGSSSWDGELTQRCADGRSIIVESRWAAQRAPDGSLLGFMEVNRDVTARKETEREMRRAAKKIRSLNATLEQQVRQRTIHLERANKSLEAFAYSIAHDLRTPLRGISGFAEVLVNDYGDQLDETGRTYATRVRAGCARMAALIDDLLNLSQVTQAEMNLQDVDLSAEVTAICDQLAARDPGRQVRVTVQDGVRVTADKSLIRGVLENLLENAWKFTAQRKDTVVEFATTPVDEAAICCYVRDNGAGFDPAYTGKLFQPFQRLHDASEFPGTGIGLASVQRIIERHGGRTWAEGIIDGGATIYFTLNAKGPHA